MTNVEKARNKVIRRACAMYDGFDDENIRELLLAVEALFLAQTAAREARRVKKKK